MLAVLAGVLLVSCQSRIQRRGEVPPQLECSALIVYPFRFLWSEAPYRQEEMAQRLLRVAAEEVKGQAFLFGPPEFSVFHIDEPAPSWLGSDALQLLPPYAIPPEHGLVLRASADLRVASGQHELLNAKGKAEKRMAHEERSYVGRVEIVHPSSSQVLLELEDTVTVDPFAERAEDEADPAPELTALMERLAHAALREFKDRWRAPKEPLAPLAQVTTLPSHEKATEGLDLLDAELLRHRRLRFANPEMGVSEADQLVTLPAGLYVVKAPSPTQLEEGDVILQINGQPALPQMLERLRLANAPARILLRKKSGEQREQNLPSVP